MVFTAIFTLDCVLVNASIIVYRLYFSALFFFC